MTQQTTYTRKRMKITTKDWAEIPNPQSNDHISIKQTPFLKKNLISICLLRLTKRSLTILQLFGMWQYWIEVFLDEFIKFHVLINSAAKGVRIFNYFLQYIYDTSVKRKNLESDSCKNFPSKLTRSTSSLKMGANSQACFQWLSGNDVGNKATGAWTIPTPGTTPDLYKFKALQHLIRSHSTTIWTLTYLHQRP